MNQIFITMLCVCAFILFSLPSGFAQSIEKPHTFESGKQAVASEVNENFDKLYDKINEIISQNGNGSSSIPSGVIVMWSGASNSIPEGWVLCDGNNGTPDLRDRFIIGAGNSYSYSETGGNTTQNMEHSHTISAENLETDTSGAHEHSVIVDIGPVDMTTSDPTKDLRDGDDKKAASQSHEHVVNSAVASSSGLHSHNVNEHSHGGATGVALSSVNILPPYYALSFIMKK